MNIEIVREINDRYMIIIDGKVEYESLAEDELNAILKELEK